MFTITELNDDAYKLTKDKYSVILNKNELDEVRGFYTSFELKDMSSQYEKLSNCCGASIVFTDICSSCKEHCEPMTQEEIEAEIGQQEYRAKFTE